MHRWDTSRCFSGKGSDLGHDSEVHPVLGGLAPLDVNVLDSCRPRSFAEVFDKLIEVGSWAFSDHFDGRPVGEVADVAGQLQESSAGIDELPKVDALDMATDDSMK